MVFMLIMVSAALGCTLMTIGLCVAAAIKDAIDKRKDEQYGL